MEPEIFAETMTEYERMLIGEEIDEEVRKGPLLMCCECEERKPPNEFYRCSSKINGLSANCKECSSDRCRQWRKTNRGTLTKKKREYRRRVRLEGIAAYGGKCACCGESNPEFLTMEHEKGRSMDKGRKLTGYAAWGRLKSQGWPEGYTVLCFNCNCAKGIYGECPHKAKGGDRG